MSMKKRIGVLVVLVLICMVAWNLFNKSIRETNEKLLKNEVMAMDRKVETMNLTDLTPFEWDMLYSFAPYTSKEFIYKTVGYKWGFISETVSETMNQIVFMKDGKVVCYVYGHPENMGYGLFFERSKDESGVTILYREDKNLFNVSRRDGAFYLFQSKE